jgi:hypothetical protein
MPRKDKKKYNEYMRGYLPDYRKSEHELLVKAREKFGWIPPKSKERKRK